MNHLLPKLTSVMTKLIMSFAKFNEKITAVLAISNFIKAKPLDICTRSKVVWRQEIRKNYEEGTR